jgi:hypothetical protein
MEENGFPQREYSLKRVLEKPPTPVTISQPRGAEFPRCYLIIKHLLLSILFLMVIWTLLKIPLTDHWLQEKLPEKTADSEVLFIKSVITIARIFVVILAIFGICGVIRESFSYSLVFSVFMFVRLVANFYVPYLYNGHVSMAIICVVTLLAFIFTSLVRKTDQLVKKDSDSIDL